MCKINENKSGVFVNMTFLDNDILKQINDYLNLYERAGRKLSDNRISKARVYQFIFYEKQNKDNASITYSISNNDSIYTAVVISTK